MTDESLMTTYMKGSVEGFELLYDKYSPVVHNFLKKRLRDSEADDFYQKVWRELHKKRNTYDGQPFLPWFFVLIKQLLTDAYEDLGRKSDRSGDGYADRLYKKIEETPEEVEQLLKQLPTSYEIADESFIRVVKKDILLSFRKNEILLKFICLQILGGLFSLSFCPQFGFGGNEAIRIPDGPAFAGFVFMFTGLLVLFLGMKGEEIWWVWRRYKLQLISLPVSLWGILMFFSLFWQDVSFHLWWLAAAVITGAILLTIRTSFYKIKSLK